MSAPLLPLLESSDDELERALLLSARGDMPSRSGLQDTALALGLAAPAAKALADALLSAKAAASGVHATSAAATASSATASASALTASATTSALGASSVVGGAASASVATIAKFLVGGALVSFVSMAALDRVLTPSAPPAAASQARAKSAPVAPAPVLEVAPVAPRGEPRVVTTPDDPVTAPESENRKSASKRSSAADAPPVSEPVAAAAPSNAAFAAPSVATAPSNASIAAEIRLLDRTRAALAAGDTAGAQRLLRSYDASRPSGVLSQEANLLRVRLLLAQGDRRSAATLARQIIAQHPENTHVDSLRSLAAEQ